MGQEKRAMPEGLYLNKYISNRFKANKNIIIVATGSTGSGKSYTGLRIMEHWYNHYFNSEVPIENICFSLEDVAKRLKDRNLKRYEFLMLEEAGANLGASDFQAKISKVFTYILQSFRSMNIGLIMTLPVLTMLNKQARQLLHAHLTTEGIEGGLCKLKIKIHQLNQHTGKSYWKAPIISYLGTKRKMPYITYSLASENLRKNYEHKKEEFVYQLVDNFEDNIKSKDEQAQARKHKIEIERLEKRNAWLQAHKRDPKDNKIVCINCGRKSLEVRESAIQCRLCGHIEVINIK